MSADATAILWGFLYGLAHAFEPDHVAVVSTLAGSGRAARGVAIGAMWGVGHASAVGVLGFSLLYARRSLPLWAESGFEIAAAILIVIAGVRAFRRAAVLRAHGGNGGERMSLAQSLLFGIAHGLAGTGAITAVVVGSLSSMLAGAFFLASFGLGALAGMATVAFGLAFWLQRSVHSDVGRARVQQLFGTASIAIGTFMIVHTLLR